MSHPVEGFNKVPIDGYAKVIQIEAALPKGQVKALILLLLDFKEIFA